MNGVKTRSLIMLPLLAPVFDQLVLIVLYVLSDVFISRLDYNNIRPQEVVSK